MSSATLNIKVAPRRMLSAREAADYCGLPAKHFRHDCPVSPMEMPRKKLLFDIKDLDFWIDGMKNGISADQDEIVNRLNQ